MQLYDILRSLVTNAMLVALLFTLARPKYRQRTLWVTLTVIVALDLTLNAFFYLQNDYTTLGKVDILFFILVGVVVKLFFRETLMQWLFNCASPVLLLLMLMYYVVFARSDLPAPLIAVAAFSLNVSAHAAECFRAALTATDKMQVEAARTLGFSGWQAFRLISLPQAAKIAKPTYQSTLVNLIQWTSVVGYVTITDLTRVINNIGSRTMQPLFMIVTGMLIYLALAYLVFGLFALSNKRKGGEVA